MSDNSVVIAFQALRAGASAPCPKDGPGALNTQPDTLYSAFRAARRAALAADRAAPDHTPSY